MYEQCRETAEVDLFLLAPKDGRTHVQQYKFGGQNFYVLVQDFVGKLTHTAHRHTPNVTFLVYFSVLFFFFCRFLP